MRDFLTTGHIYRVVGIAQTYKFSNNFLLTVANKV